MRFFLAKTKGERKSEIIYESFSRWTKKLRLEKEGSETRKGMMNCAKMIRPFDKRHRIL